METIYKIKEMVDKMLIDSQKVYEKGNHNASVRSRKYAQELKHLLVAHRKEVLIEDKRHWVLNEQKRKIRKESSELKKQNRNVE